MWGRVDVDIMINYLALQGESYQNMLRMKDFIQKDIFLKQMKYIVLSLEVRI